MMLHLPKPVFVHGPHLTAELAGWAAAQMPHVDDFGPCWAVGIARRGVDGERDLAAVVVFHDLQARAQTAQVSMAAVTPRWASRAVVAAVLRAGFDDLGVRLRKIATVNESTNARAHKFVAGIGFVREAVLREQFAPKVHACCWGMMRREFLRRYGEV